MSNRSVRDSKIKIATHQLEEAIHILNELSWDSNNAHDVSKANAWGISALVKLGVIEVAPFEDLEIAIVKLK